MKILQVISYFYPAWAYGGPGRLVYELSSELTKLDHDVTIFTTDAFDNSRRRGKKEEILLNKESFKLYAFKNISNSLAFHSKIFFPPGVLPAIILNLKKFDLIHIQEFFTPLAFSASFFAYLFNIPYVLSAHGTLDKFHMSHRKKFKQLFMKLFGNFMLKNASCLIAATKEEIDEYSDLGIPKSKIYHIRNGINIVEFEKLPAKTAFKKKYKISFHTKIILYLGRINKLKGLDKLLDAFIRLLEEFNDIKLVISGSDDGYKDALIEKINNNDINDFVIFTGIISGKDKLELYSDADLFVYPSPSEGFSLAVIEAAASGLPLIITSGCKFPEVEKYKAGLISEPQAYSLYKALIRMLEDNDFRVRSGRNAQKLSKLYSINNMSLNLIKIYKHL